MLRRNLVDTAVTRGKKLVVIVGQPKALAIAARSARARRRWSKLKDWLGGEDGAPCGPIAVTAAS
jgi:exodeoxyribonuclease V alpha subunit